MDIVIERLQMVTRSLDRLNGTLQKIGNEAYSLDFEEMRDSAIQRFEFSLDTFFKFIHSYLKEVEGVDLLNIHSPRATFRVAFQAGLLTKDDFTLCIDMVEDRNRTSHTYNEETAEEIFGQIPKYYVFMDECLKRLKKKIN